MVLSKRAGEAYAERQRASRSERQLGLGTRKIPRAGARSDAGKRAEIRRPICRMGWRAIGLAAHRGRAAGPPAPCPPSSGASDAFLGIARTMEPHSGAASERSSGQRACLAWSTLRNRETLSATHQPLLRKITCTSCPGLSSTSCSMSAGWRILTGVRPFGCGLIVQLMKRDGCHLGPDRLDLAGILLAAGGAQSQPHLHALVQSQSLLLADVTDDVGRTPDARWSRSRHRP